MTDRLYQIISNVLEIPKSEINDNVSPDDIETWDSFNGLLLADELETQFNIRFTNEEMLDVKTVADIKRHLRNHGIVLDE